MANKFFNTDDKDEQRKLLEEGELCAGDECGGVIMLTTDMTKSCYGDWYCNDCMFRFMAEQEQFNRDMVGGDDPCEYE